MPTITVTVDPTILSTARVSAFQADLKFASTH
jgi:hypothetical protein